MHKQPNVAMSLFNMYEGGTFTFLSFKENANKAINIVHKFQWTQKYIFSNKVIIPYGHKIIMANKVI